MSRFALLSVLVGALFVNVAVAEDKPNVELGPNANLGGVRLLPDDSPWQEDISGVPVDPRSEAILARIGLDKPLHADFGDEWEGVPIGIPYVVVGDDQERPAGWTSADAAGLPILPGLARYDEAVEKGTIEHALRFTLSKTRRAYVPPASHWASDDTDETLPPMGMRVRLRADYDISGFSSEAQAILQALKTYGMILADNGSDNFISGTHDPRWDADAIGEIRQVKTKDLEVVEMTGLVADD
jgi:hypothetical protein